MKMLYERIRDGFRNLFNIRQKRRAAPVGSRPAKDSWICRGSIKMLVTHDIDNTLWQWLALNGWRKITVPNDRRRYRRLPKEALRILIKAPQEELDAIHGRMMAAVAKSSGGSRAGASRKTGSP